MVPTVLWGGLDPQSLPSQSSDACPFANPSTEELLAEHLLHAKPCGPHITYMYVCTLQACMYMCTLCVCTACFSTQTAHPLRWGPSPCLCILRLGRKSPRVSHLVP